MNEIITGIYNACTPYALLANASGVFLGIIFGSIPGLTASMGIALLIPLTFGLPPVDALAMLLGMYAGAIYGGSISAILLGTPGTVAAAATVLEGPHLTAQGQSRKALEMATFASFFGGICSAIFLVLCAPLLASIATSFGSAEYFALAVFALCIVSTLSSNNPLKGLAATFAGLYLSTIGIDPISGDFRNTFNNHNLFSGLSLVPILVGLFAISQVLISIESIFAGKNKTLSQKEVSNKGLSFKEIYSNKLNLIRSSLIGIIMGVIPATGPTAAAFIAYAESKRHAKKPELYGKGSLEAIAATESANNGATGGALIPMLTLGVPGDVLTAIMLGALLMQGLAPGPLLFEQHKSTVMGIFAAFFIANFLILAFGYLAIRFMGKVVTLPTAILMPIVLILCTIGSYSVNHSSFDLIIMFVFGIVGFGMLKLNVPQAPLLLALVLAPLAESNFRRTLTISRNDFSVFFTSPIACVILIISAFILLKSLRDVYKNMSQT